MNNRRRQSYKAQELLPPFLSTPGLHYRLKGKFPVEERNMLRWARSRGGHKSLKRTYIGDIYVSTVFLGINHSFLDSLPVLFETMVFGGEHNHYQERYYTYKQAIHGHNTAVKMVRRSTTGGR